MKSNKQTLAGYDTGSGMRDMSDVCDMRDEAPEQSHERRTWRGLESVLPTDMLDEDAEREFPHGVLEHPTASRREFFALMGASLALSGLTGCQAPREEIIPYIDSPEQIVAGKPLYFATSMTRRGVATGLLVEQHMGRPIKVEGNPDHPASLGATDVFAQASVLSLYDPDRSSTVLHEQAPSSWPAAVAAWQTVAERLRTRNGAGLHILTGAVTSPTFAWQMEQLLRDFPEAVWHQFEPVSHDGAQAGLQQAYGKDLDFVYHPEQADILLSLDSNFLHDGPGHLRYARQFMDRRRVWQADLPEQAAMNRLYAVGPTPTPTSSIADHHLPIRAAEVVDFAHELAVRLGVLFDQTRSARPTRFPDAWMSALVDDLRQHRGRSLIVAGDQQSAEVHALASAMNMALENVGHTVTYIPPTHARPKVDVQGRKQSDAPSLTTLTELTRALERGAVEALIVLGVNPVFSAPADLEFARHFQQAPYRLHLGLYRDETAKQCSWHIPESHFLESWGDARAFDGTVSLVQPLIRPIHTSVCALQLISMLRGRPQQSGYDLVRQYWKEQGLGEQGLGGSGLGESGLDDTERAEQPGFERAWRRAVHDGIIANTRFSSVDVELRDDWWDGLPKTDDKESASNGQRAAISQGAGDRSDGILLELVFVPDPTIDDGQFANNAWLQELPKPLTNTTWDNVVLLGPETARAAGLSMEVGNDGGMVVTDVAELIYRGRSLEAPIWILPGHAENSATVYFGYGRRSAGQVGNGRGFDAFRLRCSDRPWFDSGLRLRSTGKRYELASTQLHHVMRGRDIVRHGTLEQYVRNKDGPAKSPHKAKPANSGSLPIIDLDESQVPESDSSSPPSSLYPEYSYRGHKWGMMIDQTACLGCNACVIACQAENNIPTVGKREVMRGREMHWLRIDTYYHGEDPGRPEATYFQPVPCMHCENAPCELVCPVNATVHSDEGLNDMVYNRCVGTRYCSNNCPYKVRRFNYLEYADWAAAYLRPLRNPDVTVRSRGVMEKCTYCVQRINAARIHAEKDNRPLKRNLEGQWVKPIYENELLTACQAACPTQAIAFGDLNDADTRVTQMQHQPLAYGLLAEELGTQPRTRYLAALRNPHPLLHSR
jgi:Fe-S-cluster-containing dehydrogenase component/anaerobic selenocysteine-containing dehydrogenase